MQLIFRKLAATDLPAPGELFIQSAAADGSQRDELAMRAAEQGLPAFPQGAGPIRALVVMASPTLDDMLAALFVEELLEGRTLPPGAQAFANYARLRRKGLSPSSVPLEVSLEGIYLAILNARDGDLTKPDTAAQFTTAWRRMARVILQAAAANSDPFATPLFSQGGDFAEERAFLAQDRAVFQLDVRRGKQWIAKIPGAARGGRMLLLRQPKSLLLPQWSREKGASGAGQPFAFLAVDWGSGCWVFSTDPVQKLPIPSLADVLQKAEADADSQHAASQPWAKRFNDTMVASRQTKLPGKKVVARMKHWAHAWPIVSPWVYATAAVLLVLVILHFIPTAAAKPIFRGPNDSPVAPPEPVSISADELKQLTGPDKNYALLFATNNYKLDPYGEQWDKLAKPISDVDTVATILQSKYDFEVAPPYHDQTKKQIEAIIHQFLEDHKFGPQSELLIYFAGHGYFDKTVNKGYIVASDSLSSQKGAERNASCISLDDLASTLDKVSCRHVLLLLDTCFGGTVLPKYALGKTRGESVTRPTEAVIGQLLGPKSRIVLASVGKREALDESPFAQRVIETLQGKTSDSLVTAHTLYASAANSTQAPAFGGLPGQEDGGEFLFVPAGK